MLNFKVCFLLTLIFGWSTLGLFLSGVSAEPDCMQPYCHCVFAPAPTSAASAVASSVLQPPSVFLHCDNFTTYSQLDFKRVSDQLFDKVELRPSSPQVLLDMDASLDFTGLSLNGQLVMANIKSFSTLFSPFRRIAYDRFDLVIHNSYMDFYDQGINGCNTNDNNNSSSSSTSDGQADRESTFSHLIVDELTFSNVYFVQSVCPHLFAHTRIFNLRVRDSIGQLVFVETEKDDADDDDQDDVAENRYQEKTTTTTSTTNGANELSIGQVEFDYGSAVDTQHELGYLSPLVFAELDRVMFTGQLVSISARPFQTLRKLKKLELKVGEYIRPLLEHTAGDNSSSQWLANLNSREPEHDLHSEQLNMHALTDHIFQLIVWIPDQERSWPFDKPEDICLFRHFPHNRLVFPFLVFSTPQLPCTCLIRWLYKYAHIYQTIYNLNQDNVPYHCLNDQGDQQQQQETCDFDALFNTYCPDEQQKQQQQHQQQQNFENIANEFNVNVDTDQNAEMASSTIIVTDTTPTTALPIETSSSSSSSSSSLSSSSSSSAAAAVSQTTTQRTQTSDLFLIDQRETSAKETTTKPFSMVVPTLPKKAPSTIKPSTTPASVPTPLSPSDSSLNNNNNEKKDSKASDYSSIAFYLAITLSITAAVITVTLLVLFYRIMAPKAHSHFKSDEINHQYI